MNILQLKGHNFNSSQQIEELTDKTQAMSPERPKILTNLILQLPPESQGNLDLYYSVPKFFKEESARKEISCDKFHY